MRTGDHEHREFEKYATEKELNREQHPLHLLYLNDATANALDAFKAGYAAAKQETTRRMQVDYEYPNHIFHEIIRTSPYAFYLFQWVPYQTDARKWRLKMCHDVKTFDGREEFGIWPNSDRCGSFKDDEVEFIRVSRSQHGNEYIDPRDKKSEE